MDWLKIKEFFRGTDCWNCRWKNNCLSYQATKNDKLTVSVCKYKDYKCNPFQVIDVNTVLKQIARMKKKASVELNKQILAGYVTALEEVEIVINDLIQLSGAPLEAVQDQLGHTDIKTTRIYCQLSGQRRKEIHDRYF